MDYLALATAVGTLGAALLAGFSVIAAVQIAMQQRADQYVELRLSYLVELLLALEGMEQHRPMWRPRLLHQGPDTAPRDVEMKEARARFNALLLAAREDLPWTRRIVRTFEDPDRDQGSVDELMRTLDALGANQKYGPPDDEVDVRVQRAEIKAAIDELHGDLGRPRGLLRSVFGRRSVR